MEKQIISLLFNLLVSTYQQEWHKGEAVEQFGPEVSEKSACMAAENKAILNVVREVSGESVSASQFQMCNEMSNEICQMLISSTTYTEGMVTGLRNINTEVSGSGIRACKVSLEVSISKDNSNSDVGFDLEVKLSKTQVIDKELFTINVNPTQPAFLNFFYFSPYFDRQEQVKLLYTPLNIVTEKVDMPEKPMYFGASFPNNKTSDDIALEVIMIVATKKPVTFKKVFSLAEFNQRIQEIPKSERRIIRTPYFIWAKDKKHNLR